MITFLTLNRIHRIKAPVRSLYLVVKQTTDTDLMYDQKKQETGEAAPLMWFIYDV